MTRAPRDERARELPLEGDHRRGERREAEEGRRERRHRRPQRRQRSSSRSTKASCTRIPVKVGGSRRSKRGRAPRRAAAGHEGRREAHERDDGRSADQGDGQVSDERSAARPGERGPRYATDDQQRQRRTLPPPSSTARAQRRRTGRPSSSSTGVTKTFFRGKEPLTVLDGLSLDIEEGALRGADGPLGLRQVDAPQPHRRPRSPDERHAPWSRATTSAR